MVLLVLAPYWEVPDEIAEAKRIELVSNLRGTWATIAGGVVVIIGLAIAMYRAEAAMKQAQAMEQGNITERFTRAIDQLGKMRTEGGTEVPHTEIRLGGIYGLGQSWTTYPSRARNGIATIVGWSTFSVPISEAGHKTDNAPGLPRMCRRH